MKANKFSSTKKSLLFYILFETKICALLIGNTMV
jgi:hypothetical protein